VSVTELHAARAALPETVVVGARIAVHAGTITAIESEPLRPGREVLAGTLLPGFVDLQVNGGKGRSVDEATADALDAVAQSVWDGAAVAFLPTLITAPWEKLLQQVEAVGRWIGIWNGAGAEPLGLHVEGPFLDAPGAHDARWLVDPTPERIDALLAAARGRIQLVTLSCSRKGAPAAVARLRAAGVAVAIGHAASSLGFEACIAAGAGLVTHLFNVMGPLHHREPGVAGLALDTESLLCPLLADGHHVHPAMVRNAFKILGPDRTVLATDATAAAGMPDGRYRLGAAEVVLSNGAVHDAQGRLAGSALTMAQAARNFLQFVPQAGPWTLALAAATNPARAIGAEDYGRIAPGAKAAFTLLEDDGTLRAVRA
jgi:N-acetylglucosamine-6-phosphate deacetylase